MSEITIPPPAEILRRLNACREEAAALKKLLKLSQAAVKAPKRRAASASPPARRASAMPEPLPADPSPVPLSYTVADLAHRWRVGEDKVRTFLRRGELIGVNVATDRAGKPRWRITAESVRAFEERRSSAPPPRRGRRQRRAVIDYCADLPD